MGRNRKQSRLLEKVRQLESAESILRDYRQLKLTQADAAAAAAADAAESAIMRRYTENNFASVDVEELAKTLVASRVEKENAAYRALLTDALLCGRSLSDEEQLQLAQIHAKKLQRIEEDVREQLSSQAAAASTNTEDIQYSLEQAAQARAKHLHAAELKKAAISRSLDRRIAAAAKKRQAVEARLRGMSGAEGSLSMDESLTLSVKGLKMYFGGVKAVDDLSFDVRKGEIFGLIGPNGAGKTTVFNCITQFYKPTGGTLLFRGAEDKIIDLTKQQVHDVILTGIVRTFQNVEVVPEMSVLENLLVAGHRQFTSGLAVSALHLPKLAMEEQVIRARAEKVLDFMGLTAYSGMYAMGLPYGILKKIEIARTLMASPRLIILDEPAAGLNDTETAELAQLIRRIRDEYKCTILLVEHDMSLVMDVCDSICAIAFGKLLAYGTPAEIQANTDVQQAYLGVAEEEAE